MSVLTPNVVFRDHVTQGVSASGPHKPSKAEIRQLLNAMQDADVYSVTTSTLADLQAITPTANTYPLGRVTDDATATNNGIYAYDWDTSAWVRDRSFPDTISVLSDVAGTANAITANSLTGVDIANVVAFVLQPVSTNTGDVTLSVNGGAAKSLLGYDGNELAPGALVAGRLTMLIENEDEYRLLLPELAVAAFDHQGDWAAPTTYTEGQVVTGSNGNWYQLKAASSTGDDPVGSVTGDWLQILAAAAIPDGSLVEAKYATGSVSTRALADGAATTDKLGDEAVTPAKLAAEAVTEEKILSTLVDDFRRVGPGLSDALNPLYQTATKAMIPRMAELAMCGHFHRGSWELASAPVFAAPPAGPVLNHATIDFGDGTSTPGDRLYEAWGSQNVWENIWAVANDGDPTFSYKTTPSLRVGSVSGSVITLNDCGENSYPFTPSVKTFQFGTDALVGVKVLIVTETVAGRTKAWSGRKATITANTGSTITLDSILGITAGDYFILLPNTDHYVWLCDIYVEDDGGSGLSIRNIGSQGPFERQSRMVNITQNYPAAGVAITSPPGQKIYYAGSISPLARSVIALNTISFGNSSLGSYAEYVDQDGGNHNIDTHYVEKDTTDGLSSSQRMIVCGSYGPWWYFENGGSNIANVSAHNLLVLGWKY